jgi:hypothetical protein
VVKTIALIALGAAAARVYVVGTGRSPGFRPKASSMIVLSRVSDSGVGDVKSANS